MSTPTTLLLGTVLLALVYLFLRDQPPTPSPSETIVVLPRRPLPYHYPRMRLLRHLRRRRRSGCRSCR